MIGGRRRHQNRFRTQPRLPVQPNQAGDIGAGAAARPRSTLRPVAVTDPVNTRLLELTHSPIILDYSTSIAGLSYNPKHVYLMILYHVEPVTITQNTTSLAEWLESGPNLAPRMLTVTGKVVIQSSGPVKIQLTALGRPN